MKDKLTRQMAEFDNFRKRTEREKDSMFDSGAASVVEKILPVIDNFERALEMTNEKTDDAFAEGMKKIYKQFGDILEKMEVKPIEAVGKTFDPELHNAVMHIDDDNYGENEIVEDLQKGYTFHGTVIRHSMVKVAN